MRELSTTLLKAQQMGTLNPLYKLTLTKGATTYTYGKDRILPSAHDEEPYSHRATIVLNNSDNALDSVDLKGYKGILSLGIITKVGEEYSATGPVWVIDQQFDSDPNKLICTLTLQGAFNLMADDEASANYIPADDDTKVVKTLVNEIVGATLAPFTHCKSFDVVWDTGYDALANTYKPKDGFRIYVGGNRLAALRRVLDYTSNVARWKVDGNVHIMKAITSGVVYDYEYSLETGHKFFSKAYRNSLTIPNKIYIKSYQDDDPQYSGSAQIQGYDSLPEEVKKTHYIQMKLESNDQANSIATALIAKAEMWSARGAAEVPLNCGAEVFDYVKVTDSRQGDTRTGNLGYVHRRFGKDKWTMTFGFGNWLDQLKYNQILKDLETYTDEGSYFSRLQVGSLYAYLDEITDGPDVYVRQRSLQLNASGVFISEDTLYTIRVPGGPQHNLHKSITAPSSPQTGDFWIDTNYTPNLMKMWNGVSWAQLTAAEVAEFNRGTIYRELKSVALTADGLVIMDEIQAGTYGKVKAASLSAAGLVLVDQTVDGTYGKVKTASLSADGLVLTDQLADGTYGKVKIGALTLGEVDLAKAGVINKTAANISETTTRKWAGETGADVTAGQSITVMINRVLNNIADSTDRKAVTANEKTGAGRGWAYIDAAGVLVNSQYGISVFSESTYPRTEMTPTRICGRDSAGNIQFELRSTDGKAIAGGGTVILDATGINITGDNKLKFMYGATNQGYISGDSIGIKVYSNSRLTLSSTGAMINIASGLNIELATATGYGVSMVACDWLTLPQASSDPTAPNGTIYFRTSDGKFRAKYAGVWYYISLTA